MGQAVRDSIKGIEDRLLTEEELDSLSERLGDGAGAEPKEGRR
jgi:hypothetical protein